jgi:hypothetical protein
VESGRATLYTGGQLPGVSFRIAVRETMDLKNLRKKVRQGPIDERI